MFIKICGITTVEDALLAVALGADAVGFILAPSKRQIAPQIVRDIARRVPPEVLTVGVFRNEHPDRVVSIVHEAGLGAAQLHGHESAAETTEVGRRVPVLIKAFAAGETALDRLDDYGADMLLIDSPIPGSGETFDWTLAQSIPRDRRVLLAGGLHHENVAEAIRQVRPWGVDVATGVERAPGEKDPLKLKAFIEEARAVPMVVDPDEPHLPGRPFDWVHDGDR
ncbi:MAG: phosphoribosylanthranilate isomerase [Acidimicrobiales bacterium]|nr:phosphoribosylanthranilate isomerase [Acidimicrobiales bacterium]